MPEETTSKSNKKVYIIVIILLLLFTGTYALEFFGGLPTLTNWIFTMGKKQPTLEEILEGTKPTAPREYTYQQPTKETLNRTIDCKKIHPFSDLKPENPLCLNLYRTSADEIDKEIRTGKYDRVVVYGQNIIFDAPSKWEYDEVPGKEKPVETSVNRDKLGQRIYDNAKFSDQVVMPAMIKLYGLKDLSIMNTVFKKTIPFPAIYTRASSFQDRKILCKNDQEAEGAPLGCAKNTWTNVTYGPNALGDEPYSMPNQRVHRNGREDFLYFDQMAPQNCLAEESFMHETAHNLYDLSMLAGGHATAESQLDYFNEHQAGFVGDMHVEIACGDGNVVNLRTNKDVPFQSIMAYNSIYPAGEMSGSHPEGDNCKLAVLTQWNRILNDKNWKDRYSGFYSALRDKVNYSFSDEKGFEKFMANASGDPKAKEFLNSYGCGL